MMSLTHSLRADMMITYYYLILFFSMILRFFHKDFGQTETIKVISCFMTYMLLDLETPSCTAVLCNGGWFVVKLLKTEAI